MVKPKQSNPAGSPHLDKAVWILTEECIEESTANKKNVKIHSRQRLKVNILGISHIESSGAFF